MEQVLGSVFFGSLNSDFGRDDFLGFNFNILSGKGVKFWSEVIQLLEGSIAPAECVDKPEVCSRSELCASRDIWDELKKAIDEVLESTTLQDLVVRHIKKEQLEPAMYYV